METNIQETYRRKNKINVSLNSKIVIDLTWKVREEKTDTKKTQYVRVDPLIKPKPVPQLFRHNV